MQYRVYNRQTLEYVDGGYVEKFNIDDDYIVNNNSTISVVKNVDNTLKNVVIGDIIALIQDSGAYHKGVITAVDDTDNTISYRADKELFNDNIPNPMSPDYIDNEDFTVKFGVDILITLLKHYFYDTDDELKRLPLVFVADGDVLDEEGNPKMLWTWSNDSINIVDWLTELFEKYNLSLDWDIDFDISKDLTIPRLNADGTDNSEARHAKYIVTLSAIVKSGGIVKDNVDMQTITYTVKEIPDATVCYVIDSSTKEIVTDTDGKPAIYYLYEKDGEYSVSTEKAQLLDDGRERVLPVKTTIATYSESSTSTDETTDETTPEDTAKDTLIPSQFNQAIEIRISADSKMFDFANAKFGDQYQIINERGSVNSVFTGKKISSENKWVTLYFGLGRQRYTDLIQLKLRKSRYTQVYNQG